MTDHDIKPAKRPRSALGAARDLYQEAVDHCEALYLQAAGEVTEEVEQAEAARELAGREALEALARYERWLDGREHTAKEEQEAIDRFKANTKRRRAWVDEQVAQLSEAIYPGRTKIQAGIHTVKLRHSVAVVTDAKLDIEALPPGWRREVPEKITPATVELDKKAAKADLLLGYREGEPPGAGWYDVEGHGRLWLYRGEATGQWRVARGGPGDPSTSRLCGWGLAIEHEPGLDVLLWKPSPPGVALERRVHVKVG